MLRNMGEYNEFGFDAMVCAEWWFGEIIVYRPSRLASLCAMRRRNVFAEQRHFKNRIEHWQMQIFPTD